MKMPGVSLTAVASPIPTPANLLPRATRISRSAATRNSSRVLTCPKLTVSRIGSNAATRQSATAKANHRVHPCRRAIGSTSHHSTTPVVTTAAMTLNAIATCHPTYAIGSIVKAAKGGYVKPYLVLAARKS